VLGEKDVAGRQAKDLAVTRDELERAAERDHNLSMRCVVPGERRSRRALVEAHARRIHPRGRELMAGGLAAELALLAVRLAAGPRVQPHQPDHRTTAVAFGSLNRSHRAPIWASSPPSRSARCARLIAAARRSLPSSTATAIRSVVIPVSTTFSGRL